MQKTPRRGASSFPKGKARRFNSTAGTSRSGATDFGHSLCRSLLFRTAVLETENDAARVERKSCENLRETRRSAREESSIKILRAATE
jgi:hypothetical protein